ncbi:MAG: hypothetical protein QOC62_1190, partial [Mycobacterium sp.]|nr:hypothetical protein [Mycobacterium sp.]
MPHAGGNELGEQLGNHFRLLGVNPVPGGAHRVQCGVLKARHHPGVDHFVGAHGICPAAD